MGVGLIEIVFPCSGSLDGVEVELDKGSDALEDSLTMNKFGPSYMKNIKLVSGVGHGWILFSPLVGFYPYLAV